VLGRDCLIDLDGGMQRAGKRGVFDHRNRMLAGDLLDFQIGASMPPYGAADG
jgi:hypothetical protein